MPDFTITLSPKAVQRLKKLLARTNARRETDLTLPAWMQLHMKEMAIGDTLATAMTALQEQHELDARDALQAAIDTTRTELLDGLDKP